MAVQNIDWVIDYKKLKENTILDRYPMQDASVILAYLGKAKYC